MLYFLLFPPTFSPLFSFPHIQMKSYLDIKLRLVLKILKENAKKMQRK